MMSEMGLAFSARRAGELDLADKHLLHLLDGVPRGPGVEPALHLPSTLVELGLLTERRGDPAAALELHREALDAAQLVGDPRTLGLRRRWDRPARSPPRDPTRGPPGCSGWRQPPATTTRPLRAHRSRRTWTASPTAARAALGDNAFAEAYEEGGRTKLDDAATALT